MKDVIFGFQVQRLPAAAEHHHLRWQHALHAVEKVGEKTQPESIVPVGFTLNVTGDIQVIPQL